MAIIKLIINLAKNVGSFFSFMISMSFMSDDISKFKILKAVMLDKIKYDINPIKAVLNFKV